MGAPSDTGAAADEKTLAFEDLTPGLVIELGSRSLSRERIVSFAREFDPQPFHLDEEAGRQSLFGGLAASGWHSGSTLMRLMVDGLLNRTTSLGSPGIEELRWRRPVFPDVPLAGRATVESARLSASRPGVGLVLLRSELLLPDGETAMMMRSWGLFGCRAVAPEQPGVHKPGRHDTGGDKTDE